MQPNIIIFNPDQMRADALAHLGNPASSTPFLDGFAREEAVSFRNAFCQNPVCVPSRCSFFTGLYPHVHGHRTMQHLLHDGDATLLSQLKDAGYHVWMNDRNDLLAGQEPGLMARHADEVFTAAAMAPPPGPEDPGLRGQPGDKNYYSGSSMTLLGKGVASGGDGGVRDILLAALTQAGFEPEELPAGRVKGVNGFTADMRERYSAVCIFADMTGFAQMNHMQLEWPGPMSAQYPWYVHEVPTVFVSLNYTHHLHDVPRVPVFINAYNDQPETIQLVVDKLTGKSDFQGKYDELVWCNGWDTHF